MKCVIIPLPTGQVVTIVPVGNVRLNETEADYLARITSEAIANDAASPQPLLTGASNPVIVETDSLPQSARRWRAAWRWLNGSLAINLATARLIRKAELLALRDTRLDRVRKKRQEADEDGKTAIATALKQRASMLRGLDSTIDGQLANVSDLVTLDTWTPTEFSGATD